jgi:uncharacterized protein YjbI with pentapeptide repeats
VKYDGTNLKEVLAAHRNAMSPAVISNGFLSDEECSIADFSYKNLINLDFRGKELNSADFSHTYISGCNFSGAELRYANFEGAEIRDSRFSNANLYSAKLSSSRFMSCQLNGAKLGEACMYECTLGYCNLKGAKIDAGTDFHGANMIEVKHMPYIPMVCPEEGQFIGWKKCRVSVGVGENAYKDVIVKLLIPARARRSSGFSRKCRASEAIVLAIQDINGRDLGTDIVAVSKHDSHFGYRVGETVTPAAPFFTDRWIECAPGIHFFMNRREAVLY